MAAVKDNRKGNPKDTVKAWREDRHRVVDALLVTRVTAMEASARAESLLQDVPLKVFGIEPMQPHPSGFNPFQIMFKRSGYRKDKRTGATSSVTKSAYARELEDVALPWVTAAKQREVEKREDAQAAKAELDHCAREALRRVGYLFNEGSQSSYFAARHKAIAQLMTVANLSPEEATEAVDRVLHGRYVDEGVK